MISVFFLDISFIPSSILPHHFGYWHLVFVVRGVFFISPGRGRCGFGGRVAIRRSTWKGDAEGKKQRPVPWVAAALLVTFACGRHLAGFFHGSVLERGAFGVKIVMWEVFVLLGQWLNFKLFGITYLVGKIKFKLFFSGSIGWVSCGAVFCFKNHSSWSEFVPSYTFRVDYWWRWHWWLHLSTWWGPTVMRFLGKLVKKFRGVIWDQLASSNIENYSFYVWVSFGYGSTFNFKTVRLAKWKLKVCKKYC